MVDTRTPQGSSSCLRVSLRRLRAALEAPYAARQGKGWSPEYTGTYRKSCDVRVCSRTLTASICSCVCVGGGGHTHLQGWTR